MSGNFWIYLKPCYLVLHLNQKSQVSTGSLICLSYRASWFPPSKVCSWWSPHTDHTLLQQMKIWGCGYCVFSPFFAAWFEFLHLKPHFSCLIATGKIVLNAISWDGKKQMIKIYEWEKFSPLLLALTFPDPKNSPSCNLPQTGGQGPF